MAATIEARKNLETDNPKFDREGYVWCLVLKDHIKAESKYKVDDQIKTTFEDYHHADKFQPSLIEAEEAYDLYLKGYVAPHPKYKDPRPRAELKPYLSKKQQEAKDYLEGKNRKHSNWNEVPDFVIDTANAVAQEETNLNYKAIKEKALRGE